MIEERLAKVGSFESSATVAPSEMARARLDWTGSTAMIVSAPARRAPMIADRPRTGPEDGESRARCDLGRFMTAPMPVMTAQPTRAATSRSVEGGSTMHDRSATSMRAKVER